MTAECKRIDGEDYTDYFVRLFEHKSEYGLNCTDVARLLNKENGNDYGESAYRKEWAAFNRGRHYERNSDNSRIATRILSISDLHIPFELPIETFSDYAGCVDILQINGDVSDCQAISKFPKAYRVSPMEEIIKTRQYLIDLLEYIRPKKLIVNYGNHDIRYQNYLARALDNDIVELSPSTSLELIICDGFYHYNKRDRTKVYYAPLKQVVEDVEIEYIDNWYCKIGSTIFCHPLSYSSGMLKTTEKAVDYFFRQDRDFKSIVMAHTHKLGSYVQGNIHMYEQGCCCDIEKIHYANGRLTLPQQEGFIYICQDKNGDILPDKTKLIEL